MICLRNEEQHPRFLFPDSPRKYLVEVFGGYAGIIQAS